MRILRAGISNEGGFTLVELSVVILLLSFLLLLTLPRFSGLLGGQQLRSSANMLVGLARHLANRAAASRQTLFLHYNFKENTFWVTTYDQEGNQVEVHSSLGGKRQLPSGVVFADIVTPQFGKVSEGEVFTRFFPNGLVETSTIHLRNSAGKLYTVVIYPLAGRAKVYKGYVEHEER